LENVKIIFKVNVLFKQQGNHKLHEFSFHETTITNIILNMYIQNLYKLWAIIIAINLM
jgi:hypothetical protein